jgi:hypothetical protein
MGITGCSKKEKDLDICEGKEIYEEKGMIKYDPPPDSCDDYMIVFNGNEFDKYYKPGNLPDDFKIDSLQIEVRYCISEEQHNCGFGGYVPIINILNIKKL